MGEQIKTGKMRCRRDFWTRPSQITAKCFAGACTSAHMRSAALTVRELGSSPKHHSRPRVSPPSQRVGSASFCISLIPLGQCAFVGTQAHLEPKWQAKPQSRLGTVWWALHTQRQIGACGAHSHAGLRHGMRAVAQGHHDTLCFCTKIATKKTLVKQRFHKSRYECFFEKQEVAQSEPVASKMIAEGGKMGG